LLTGFAEGVGAFVGVVNVNAHPDGAVFFEDVAKFGGDALGEENGNAGTDANKFKVRNSAEFPEEVIEFFIGEEEGVSAAEEDVADFGVLADVLEAGFKFWMEVVVLGVGDEATAGAVAAIGSATIRDEKENAVRVAMNDAVNRFGFFFSDGVEAFFGGGVGLAGARDDLAADRIFRILGVDEVEKVRGDREGEFFVGEKATGALVGIEFKVLFQILKGG
jgi:hypothetical protein